MKKYDYEIRQLFRYLDDLTNSVNAIRDDVSLLRKETLLFHDEFRALSYKDGVEEAFSSVKDTVIDDYLSR